MFIVRILEGSPKKELQETIGRIRIGFWGPEKPTKTQNGTPNIVLVIISAPILVLYIPELKYPRLDKATLSSILPVILN